MVVAGTMLVPSTPEELRSNFGALQEGKIG
jgi:hypothetical protein